MRSRAMFADVMRFKEAIILAVIGLLLGLYAAVCFFALPFADDFCFGWTAFENISFWQKVLNQYLYWNGRYTSDVLVQFHPLLTGNLQFYQLSVLAGVVALPLALYFFLIQILQKRSHSLWAALLITAYYYTYMPDVTEELYWFIGSINYQWAHVVILLQLGFFIKSLQVEKYRALYAIVVLLLIAVGSGFNEIACVITLAFYVLFLVTGWRNRSMNLQLYALFTLAAAVCFVFVFASPGNTVRSENFTQKHQLFYSAGYSILQTARFTAMWVFTLPFAAFSFIVLLSARRIKSLNQFNFDYRVLGFLTLLVVFLGSFLPYYATGLLGQHRTINFVFLFFILLYLLFLVAVANEFQLQEKWGYLLSANRKVLIGGLSVLSMFFSGNTRKMLDDFAEGNFNKYKIAFYQRQEYILRQKQHIIHPLKEIPATFRISDTKADTAYWTDKCMYNFYMETGIKLK